MQKIRQDMEIGSVIRKLRKKAGLTQEQTVAQMQILGCSLSRSSYAKIEAGIANISVNELAALRKILKVDYNAFFSEL